jgi:hypothetical protein
MYELVADTGTALPTVPPHERCDRVGGISARHRGKEWRCESGGTGGPGGGAELVRSTATASQARVILWSLFLPYVLGCCQALGRR